VAGLDLLPVGSNPDLFVLTLPLARDHNTVAMFAFLGGFSSATSMVIVSSIALSTMISNHIVMPLALRFSLVPVASPQTVRSFILGVRRISILFILALGFLYFRLSGSSDALATIGLISFCGVAQFLPSLVSGLYWRRATHGGAIAGLAAGFLIWGYSLFLPSFEGSFILPAHIIEHGPFGIEWLKPQALLGLTGYDPLVHAMFWSMLANISLLVGVSMFSVPTPLARFQATLFVDVFRRRIEDEQRVIRRSARVGDLKRAAERILGNEEAMRLFQSANVRPNTLTASDALISLVEQRLAANIGAASARSLISSVVTSETISVEELRQLAGEAERIRAYSAELERKTRQIERGAQELARANDRLREIDAQKDEFLSQVSHEVRTPMTSIRSFSDILLKNPDLDGTQKARFLRIIQDESLRLTRLLDGILDLNQMENGTDDWVATSFDPEATLDQAVESCEAFAQGSGVKIKRSGNAKKIEVRGNSDKLAQVFINLIANSIKFNDNPNPVVTISSLSRNGAYEVRVADNGPGIPESDRERVFDKFARGSIDRTVGSGLGLAISRQIVTKFEGTMLVTTSKAGGAEFIVRLPVHRRKAA
jgi:signal transduction histidine kinase